MINKHMKDTIQAYIVICLMAWLMPLTALAQQALWSKGPVVSPEIHDNNTVTFRLRAPKAVKVQVMGDCIAKGMADLVENKEGIWEYTTPEPLVPELYGYTFIFGIGVLILLAGSRFKKHVKKPIPTLRLLYALANRRRPKEKPVVE